MIIDIHGHYTTEPAALHQFRDKQLAALADPGRKPTTTDLGISDEELVRSVQPQLSSRPIAAATSRSSRRAPRAWATTSATRP